MERQADWHYIFSPAVHDFQLQRCNIVCHSDGGTREGSCSAAAGYIEAVVFADGCRHEFPLAMFGKYLQEPVAAFTTEVIGLDETISIVAQILRDGCRPQG